MRAVRLFIVGSGVSRDALSFAGDPADLPIAGYYARTSLATLASGPVPMPPRIGEITSNWRRRMVEADHRKVLPRSITAGTFDFLLLDLIDERFHLLETTGERVVTLSPDYTAIAPAPLLGQRVLSGSERHVALWRAGFEQLVAALKQSDRLDRLRVNRVFWANLTADGLPIVGFDPERIARANAFLRERYADIEAALGSGVFIDYPAECLVADPAHRWGLAPFHYVPAYYRHQIERLRGLAPAQAVAPPALAKTAAPAEWSVYLDCTSNGWTARIEPPDVLPAAQAAFYLMRDGKRVAMQWYGSARRARFEPQALAGNYCAVGFLRVDGAPPVHHRSAEHAVQGLPYDLERWGDPVFQHTEGDSWAGRLRDGIHQITCGGDHALDMRLQGSELLRRGEAVLVGFASAVPSRGAKSAPFFQGAGLAKQLALPILCFADPAVSRSADLNLGWYAGHRGAVDLADRIAAVVDAFVAATGSRPVLFGGSGGGFATIAVLGKLNCDACGLVWNPQTRIAHYRADFVAQYLADAHGIAVAADAGADDLGGLLDVAGVFHDTTHAAPAKRQPLLFMQNRSDLTHVRNHAEPLIRACAAMPRSASIWTSEQAETFWFGDWGNGHVPPPMHILRSLLSGLSAGTSTLALAEGLERGDYDEQTSIR